jgi:asparagine synthetase B (glutamine-hydrolysing)
MKSLSVKSYKEHLYDLTFSKSLPHLLNCDDKIAMAHSVEGRTPFLDHRIVESAFSMSIENAMKNGLRKYPLRKSMENLVPNEILFRRKKDQFAAPIEEYLKEKKIDERIHKIFKDAKSKKYFSSEKYLKEYTNYLNGNSSDIQFILKGLWVEEWMRIFEVN